MAYLWQVPLLAFLVCSSHDIWIGVVFLNETLIIGGSKFDWFTQCLVFCWGISISQNHGKNNALSLLNEYEPLQVIAGEKAHKHWTGLVDYSYWAENFWAGNRWHSQDKLQYVEDLIRSHMSPETWCRQQLKISKKWSVNKHSVRLYWPIQDSTLHKHLTSFLERITWVVRLEDEAQSKT